MNNQINHEDSLSQKEVRQLGEIMMKGDSRCKYKIGTKVKKVNEEPNDKTPSGTIGTVIGNIYNEVTIDGHNIKSGYLVKFEDKPKDAVLIVDYKIKSLSLLDKLKLFFDKHCDYHKERIYGLRSSIFRA